MLSIRLLGGFDLASVSGERCGRLGSKPKALIAYLAMSRGTAISRERLVGLLWGGHDEANARHSLRQALTSIRSAFGEDSQAVLQTSEDGVCLRSEGIELDVEKFERVARSSEPIRLREACKLYRGELLAGLEVREPEFEEWMLGERYRLGDLAESAFSELMNIQMAAGDSKAVVETSRDLIRVSPLDDHAHAVLIVSYGALGKLGLAEAHYKRCCELYRREFDRDPGEEVKSAIVTARGQSHHIIGPGNPDRQDGESRGIADRLAGREIGRSRRKRSVVAVGIVLLLLVGTGLILSNRGGLLTNNAVPTWNLPDKPSIAVLPFDSLAQDQEQIIFSRGLTNDIIADLSKFSSLIVISSESSSRFENEEYTIEDIAQKLGVRYILNGGLQLTGNTISIHVNLVDTPSGQLIWSESFSRPKEQLFAVQKVVLETLVAVIGSDYGQLQQTEIERIRKVPTNNLQAYGFFVRGFEHFGKITREDNLLSREMFENAIQIDPNYALAMAFESLTHSLEVFQGWSNSPELSLQRAEALARRAIDADRTEPRGYVALASIYQSKASNDEAISLFETAYRLNPNDFVINQALGFALTYGGFADRGVELLENAQKLNPYGTADPYFLAWAYFFAHRYEDALKTMQRVKFRSATYWAYKAAIHAQLDQVAEAKAAVAEAMKLDPELTLRKQQEKRLTSGLDPDYAEFMTGALRKAGLK
jgi:TolB-like protein/DNA-binding SARP family transcriptional activator